MPHVLTHHKMESEDILKRYYSKKKSFVTPFLFLFAV